MIVILTHGQGDMYPVLSALPVLTRERGIPLADLKIYVDTVYNSNPVLFARQLEGIKSLVESITTNWEMVPYTCSGSDTWHGIPPEDLRTGPVYAKIKNDFLFYRLDRLKDYIREKIAGDPFVLYGPGTWCYEWRDGANVPVGMAPERLTELRFPLSETQIEKWKDFTNAKHVLMQIRYKGGMDSPERFAHWIRCILRAKKIPVLLGLKDSGAFNIPGVVDLREQISFNENMWLMQKAKYAIVTGSGFGVHRLFSNKPTILILPYRLGAPEYATIPLYRNHMYEVLDCDLDINKPVEDTITRWGNSDE